MKRLDCIGIGGIGSWLVHPLIVALITLLEMGDNFDVTLCDGDAFDNGNMSRQNMSPDRTGINKAYVHTQLLSTMFETAKANVSIIPETRYVTEMNVNEIIEDGDVVVLGIDCMTSRKLIYDYMCEYLDTFLLVIAGNELHDGNVSIVLKVNGTLLSPDLVEIHPEYAEDHGKARGEMGCQEIAELPGGGQIITANFTAASSVLSAVYYILESTQWLTKTPINFNLREVYFDARELATRPAKINQQSASLYN